MSIQIGGIDLADSVINTEFRLAVLERVVDRLLRAAPLGTLSGNEMESIRKDVLAEMQRRYPQAGIGLKSS